MIIEIIRALRRLKDALKSLAYTVNHHHLRHEYKGADQVNVSPEQIISGQLRTIITIKAEDIPYSGFVRPLIAGTTIEPGVAVCLVDDKTVVPGGSYNVIGVAVQGGTAGEEIPVLFLGETWARVGGTVNPGDPLAPAEGGYLIPARYHSHGISGIKYGTFVTAVSMTYGTFLSSISYTNGTFVSSISSSGTSVISSVTTSVADFITGVSPKIGTFVSNVSETTGYFVTSVSSSYGTFVKSIGYTIANFVNSVSSTTGSHYVITGGATGDFLTGVSVSFGTFLKSVTTTTGDFITSISVTPGSHWVVDGYTLATGISGIGTTYSTGTFVSSPTTSAESAGHYHCLAINEGTYSWGIFFSGTAVVDSKFRFKTGSVFDLFIPITTDSVYSYLNQNSGTCWYTYGTETSSHTHTVSTYTKPYLDSVTVTTQNVVSNVYGTEIYYVYRVDYYNGEAVTGVSSTTGTSVVGLSTSTGAAVTSLSGTYIYYLSSVSSSVASAVTGVSSTTGTSVVSVSYSSALAVTGITTTRGTTVVGITTTSAAALTAITTATTTVLNGISSGYGTAITTISFTTATSLVSVDSFLGTAVVYVPSETDYVWNTTIIGKALSYGTPGGTVPAIISIM